MLSPKQKKRLFLGLGALVICASLVTIALITLQDNVQLYYTPAAVAEGKAPVNRPIRVGGMVVAGTLKQGEDLNVSFVLTDGRSEVKVHYKGSLPDLFREGQGVVVLGSLTSQQEFRAVQVLAKHDENYMPKELSSLQDGIPSKQSSSDTGLLRDARNDGGGLE
jgi:cytochrome c-type biogenesis protein CcmE